MKKYTSLFRKDNSPDSFRCQSGVRTSKGASAIHLEVPTSPIHRVFMHPHPHYQKRVVAPFGISPRSKLALTSDQALFLRQPFWGKNWYPGSPHASPTFSMAWPIGGFKTHQFLSSEVHNSILAMPPYLSPLSVIMVSISGFYTLQPQKKHSGMWTCGEDPPI